MTDKIHSKGNIPRTFAFDKRINPEDYLQYLEPNQLSLDLVEDNPELFQQYKNLTSMNEITHPSLGFDRSKLLNLKNVQLRKQNKLKLNTKYLLLKPPDTEPEVQENDSAEKIIEKIDEIIPAKYCKMKDLKNIINNKCGISQQQEKKNIRATKLQIEPIFMDRDFETMEDQETQKQKSDILLQLKKQNTKNLFLNRYQNDCLRRSPLFYQKPQMRFQCKQMDQDYSMKYEQYKKEQGSIELEDRIKKLSRWKSTEKKLQNDLKLSEEEFDIREVFPKTVNSIRLERLKEVRFNKEIRKTAVDSLYEKIMTLPKHKSVSQDQKNNIQSLSKSPRRPVQNPSQSTIFTSQSLTTKHQTLKNHITELITKKQGIGGKAFVFSTDINLYQNRIQTQRKNILKDQKLNFYKIDKNVTDLIRFQEKFQNIHFDKKGQLV